jgi:hypothetical protein
MIWELTTPVVQGVVEPQTVPITIKGQNEMLILLLATADGRDNTYTATFNGLPMSQWGYAMRYDYEDNQYCSIHGLYFNTSNMTPGTYNMYKNCPSGGPDDSIEAWFLIRGLNPYNPIDHSASASNRNGTITTTVNVNQDNDLILNAFYSRKDGSHAFSAVTSGLTEYIYNNLHNNQFAVHYKEADIGSHAITFLQGTDRWAQITMSLKQGHDMGSFLLNFM